MDLWWEAAQKPSYVRFYGEILNLFSRDRDKNLKKGLTLITLTNTTMFTMVINKQKNSNTVNSV